MTREEIREITILPGKNRQGKEEAFDEIIIRPGNTLSIVGPTGSGKSAFINDIEIFANHDTITDRQVLVNGSLPPEEYVRDPAAKPVALITQNTRCLCDLIVSDFLKMHLSSRGFINESCIHETIQLANQFTGEPILENVRMTSLSGGQTRSLMVADAILISNTPIILLDEVENAGIFKEKVIQVLRQHHKALLFVTHDPLVSLLSERRIVMQDGAVAKVIEPDGAEEHAIRQMLHVDGIIGQMREMIRTGEIITSPLPVSF